jgi:hypothetical protein
MFHNQFVILAIYKFCYFNLSFHHYIATISIMQTSIHVTICMVSSLESTFHTCREKFPRTSLVIRHVPPHPNGVCVCLRRELKANRHKSYPNGGEDDELVIVVGPPLRHLWRQDDATVLDIVVIEHARHTEY